MHSDRYLKSVLTVIAAALVVIAFNMTLPVANAQAPAVYHSSICNSTAPGVAGDCAVIVNGRLLVSTQ